MGHRRKLKRRKGILYEYNGDGQYSQERIKGYWNRPGAKFVCELCSKTINRSSLVPVHSLTDPSHGMWVGFECAGKFFDIKVLKRKDHFLEEHLEK